MQPDGASKPSHNPFRSLVSGSSSSTAATSSSSAGPHPPTKGLAMGSNNDIPGAERDAAESSSDSSRSPSPAQRGPRPTSAPPPSRTEDLREILRAESPPPYTPTPDVYQGEHSIEFGPRRPFQAAPPPVQPPWQASATWQPQQNTGWSGYPGSLRSHPTGMSHLNVPPPPQHPMLQRAATTGRQSAPNLARSDFARDFYAAGAANDGGILGGSSSQYAPPPGQQTNGTGSAYAPPPGAPPNASLGSGAGPAASNEGEAQSDGRPTSTPVPGHPLMNNGRVLVYPPGHECRKCRNTGYKHLDPSHPCSKCWHKYARPFTGPLQYAPWSSADSATNNFQRPLPALPHSPTSPPSGHQYSHSIPGTAPPTHPGLGRSVTTSRAGSGYPGAAYAAQGPPQPSILPIPGGAIPLPSWLGPLQDSLSPFSGPSSQYAPRALPGATVVQPGDPRIGGRLCWRCGGRGTTTFMIFDQETCGICNGVGRVFR